MITIKDLGAQLAETKVTLRGREISIRPLSAARSTLLISLNPAPPESHPEFSRLRTVWITNVELHECAVLIDLAVNLDSPTPETFPWEGKPEAQRRWLELARRQLGELLSRGEVQRVVLAADRAAAATSEEARKN